MEKNEMVIVGLNSVNNNVKLMAVAKSQSELEALATKACTQLALLVDLKLITSDESFEKNREIFHVWLKKSRDEGWVK